MKKNRREQMSKSNRVENPYLDKRIRAEVDRARSNAAGPHRLKTEYKRKPKHFNGW